MGRSEDKIWKAESGKRKAEVGGVVGDSNHRNNGAPGVLRANRREVGNLCKGYWETLQSLFYYQLSASTFHEGLYKKAFLVEFTLSGCRR